MDDLRFYLDLPAIDSFAEVFNPQHYRQVPDDWFVAVTDVVNSTQAIAAGSYKQVNVAGTLGAMALANIRRDFDFPFLFGGDGMVFVLPPSLVERARSILADVRERVRASFSLQLRAGIVPVADIYAQGADLRIGKLRVSEHYKQALFSGSGFELAEQLVKHPDNGHTYLIPETQPLTAGANLDGFSCRWQDIPSSKGEVVSLIVRLLGDDEKQRRTLQRTLDLLEQVLGDDEEYHPLSADAMRINGARDAVATEASVVMPVPSPLKQALRRLRIRFEMVVTAVILALRLPVHRGAKQLRRIREDNVINSDFRKFDGTLKMVVATSTPQREILERLLSDMQRRGALQYGLHVSDRALMTCLIHFGSGSEVHFVDGADGGYALAARQLKQRIAEHGG